MGPDSQETSNNQESNEYAAVLELEGNMLRQDAVDRL